jgi:hypothetical protein
VVGGTLWAGLLLLLPLLPVFPPLRGANLTQCDAVALPVHTHVELGVHPLKTKGNAYFPFLKTDEEFVVTLGQTRVPWWSVEWQGLKGMMVKGPLR